jgi:hypothetical protein
MTPNIVRFIIDCDLRCRYTRLLMKAETNKSNFHRAEFTYLVKDEPHYSF